MRKIGLVAGAAFVVPFLLAGCATNDGFVDDQVHDCESGSIEIRAGIDGQSNVMTGSQQEYTVLVEVANNSDEDVTVDSVRVDPLSSSRDSQYEFTGGAVRPRQVIAEAHDAVFEVPLRVRLRESNSGMSRMNDPRVRFSGAVDVSVSVALSDGETYRCRFRVGV